MPLEPGSRLGRYEVQALLGAGGMGEVYRARDSQLRRDVAIKVLRELADAPPQRARRFEQEALATASLNHPHVVAVYDAGSDGATSYVVTELLDGSDLRHVLSAGPLRPRKALEYATQIASGLAAIHEKGIVHRDLKPENVFVTRDERVKILDLGLARLVEEAVAPDEATAATAPGAILGTAGYMSPEQIRGEVVDQRSDIFAFGAVLFELVAGRRAFSRDTAPETLAAILQADPPAWDGDGTALSVRLMRLARRCLEKAPLARFQSARDLMIVLGSEAEEVSGDAVPGPPSSRARVSAAAIGAGLACLALGALAATLLREPTRSTSAAVSAPTTIKLWLPPGEAWAEDWAGTPILSRDGRRVAAVMVRGGIRRIHLLELETGQWRDVPGTEQASLGFFSPDGTRVAFVRDNALLHIGVDGTGAVKLCDCGSQVRGGDWAADGRIVLARIGQGLALVPSSGGALVTLTTPTAGEADHRYPVWLPGDDGLLFTVQDERARGLGVGAFRIGAATHSVVVPGARSPAFVEGHLVYTNDADELHGVRFDPVALAATSSPFALNERPGSGARTGDMALRASGADVVYVPRVRRLRRFDLVDRRGGRERLRLQPIAVSDFSVSPNGERVAIGSLTPPQTTDIWVFDIAADTLLQLTTDGNSQYVHWIDDRRLMFQQRGVVSPTLALALDDAGRPAGPARTLVGSDSTPMFADGDHFVYAARVRGEANTELRRAPFDGASDGEALLERPRQQLGAELSADRRWIAYVSDELGDGSFDLFVARYTLPLRPRRLIPGATGPRWSRTSAELFFVRGDSIFAASLTADGSLAGEPTRVMAGVGPSQPGLPPYDTMPDGRLLVAVPEPLPADAQSPLLVLDWAARLRAAAARDAAAAGASDRR